MRARGIALVLAALILQSGCATMSNRTKTLLLIGGVGAAAATAGYMMAPSDARPEMSAAYFGAVGAAVAGVAGLFIFDEQKRSAEFERQNTVMSQELSAYRDETTGSGDASEPKLLYETTAPFGKEIPNEYQHLVRPGHWSVYRLNQWVSQGDGVIIHQDRLVKLIPPELTPAMGADFNGGQDPVGKGAESSVSQTTQTRK